MSELFYKNLQRTENINEVFDKENLICDGIKYPIHKVPQVITDDYADISLMQKGNKEYFWLDDTNNEGVVYVLVLEEDVENMEIANTYMYIETSPKTFLSILANPNVEQLSNLLKIKLQEILSLLPYSEKEIEMYNGMVERYLERTINNDIKPVVNTQSIITQIKEKINQRDSQGYDERENKPFVTGQENWYKGKCYTKITEISKDYNIDNSTLYSRRDKGMSIKEMIETPVAKRGRGARK